MDNTEDYEEKDLLIFDTGGGQNGTITKIAWNFSEYTNNQQELFWIPWKHSGTD